MKKIAIIAAGIAILGALGWSGLWFAGKGEISRRLDAEITRLGARDLELTHGAREVGGFPFAYRVTHRDVVLRHLRHGFTYHLPEITTEVSAGDIDRLVTSFPQKFQIEVPVPAEAEAGAETLRLDVEAPNLILITDGLPGARRDFSGTAESLFIASGGEEQKLTMAFEFTGLDSKGTLPDPAVGGAATGATKLKRLDYAIAGTTSDGIPFTFEGLIDNLVLTGRTETVDSTTDTALPVLGGKFGATFQTGASKLAIRAVSGDEPQGGTLVITAASSAGTASHDGQALEIAASSRQTNMILLPEPMPEGAEAKGFGVDLRLIETIYKAPSTPSDTMTPFALRFALDEVSPDTALWGLLDASGTLPREPARLVADIEGTGRITKGFQEMRPGEALPLELGNVLVRAMDINGMGASIATRGEMEFLQPVNLPKGQVTVSLTGVLQLLRQLADNGLLAPDIAQTAAVLAALYTAPGEAQGELVSKIEMTLDGVTVNGRQVTGP